MFGSLDHRRLAGLLVCICAACSGCQKGDGLVRGSVHGRVLLDGRPLEKGQIRFTPTAGTAGPLTGAEIIDGEYAVPVSQGPVVGTHIVSVKATRKTGRQLPAVPPAPRGQMIDEMEQYIPASYNTRSVLRREISERENEANFELTSK